MVIAIDFDGTIVDHRFPYIGQPVPGAFKWMRRFQDLGAKLILFTMRSDGRADGGNYLRDAVDFCRERGVEFWGVNGNPEQHTWTGSPKAYAHTYIDDAAVGCPLLDPIREGGRKIVDWETLGPWIEHELVEEQKKRAAP